MFGEKKNTGYINNVISSLYQILQSELTNKQKLMADFTDVLTALEVND